VKLGSFLSLPLPGITVICVWFLTAAAMAIVLEAGQRLLDAEESDGPIRLKVGDSDGLPPVDRVDDDCLVSAIVPLAFEPTEAKCPGPRDQTLLQQYYDSMLAWGRLLGEHHRPVPGHPDWGYYGDGGNRENSVRPICYAALTNAFLAEIEPPGVGASHEQREEMRQQAISALGYLTHAQQVNGGACLNGRSWGNAWQSAMWTRSLGMAGWLLWERLDRPARLAVARVVEYEADRFLNATPKSSLKNDTGAEVNAWLWSCHAKGIGSYGRITLPIWDSSIGRIVHGITLD